MATLLYVVSDHVSVRWIFNLDAGKLYYDIAWGFKGFQQLIDNNIALSCFLYQEVSYLSDLGPKVSITTAMNTKECLRERRDAKAIMSF